MKSRIGYLADFISLLFPELCQACGAGLMANEKLLCLKCTYDLPYTDFHLQLDNIVARQFWGKLNVQSAYSLLYFTKGGKVQTLMHQFKYKGMHQIGNLLGSIAGEQLTKNPTLNSVDYIIPVPLHASRLKKRGYNQSACFANGLSKPLNAGVEIDNLVRIKATSTQTHRSRFSRFENMQEVFTVKFPDKLHNKHLLLVDDIITTGSTLEACGAELLKIEGVKLSIATIAYAE